MDFNILTPLLVFSPTTEIDSLLQWVRRRPRWDAVYQFQIFMSEELSPGTQRKRKVHKVYLYFAVFAHPLRPLRYFDRSPIHLTIIKFLFLKYEVLRTFIKTYSMKTITCFLTSILLSSSFCLSAQELQPAAQQRNEPGKIVRTSRADRTRVFDEEKQYIVFKLWNEAEPITGKEKTELQNLKQQLTGKNVQVIEFQYKSREDLENLFKQNGIEDVTVSTDKGISLKCKNSNYNTTNSKAVFIFEGKSPDVPKRPVMLSTGEGSENRVKIFFKLRSFS